MGLPLPTLSADQVGTGCLLKSSPTKAPEQCWYRNRKKDRSNDLSFFDVVPRAGLEPARIAPHAPQTCAATNYATSAKTLNCKELFVSGSCVTIRGVRLKLICRRRLDQCAVTVRVGCSVR